MCTVTLAPLEGGYRLVFNRDESRLRPTAVPPEIVELSGGMTAVLPRDPQGGGTWVAVNSAGLTLALVNRNPTATEYRTGPSTDLVSRGRIIPALMQARSIAEAAGRLDWMSPDDFAPFRLLVTNGRWALIAACEGHRFKTRLQALHDLPLMLTSSGLGDSFVEKPRFQLFGAAVLSGWPALSSTERIKRQDAFHQHSWADRPELSVQMSRPDARTVSRSTIEVDPAGISMRYDELDENTPSRQTRLSMPLFTSARQPA